MQSETELFFNSLVRGPQPAGSRADYTFVNKHLARLHVP